MESRPVLLAFNRGLVSPLALARVDLKRMALSAETQTNWMPRVLGAMALRPGTRLLRSTKDDAKAVHIPFVFSLTDTAILEVTDGTLRVDIDDTLITRPTVATTITTGSFDTDLTGWSDNDDVGATSAWLTGGYMSLLGDGTNYAIRRQTLTIAGGDQNVEHALSIVVTRGTVELNVGTTSGGSEYISAKRLRTGTHSIAFTPTGGTVYLQLSANFPVAVLVDKCDIEPAGIMELPAPWVESELSELRYDQSGDVLFVASGTQRQKRIERQAPRSWSVVEYYTTDGPFLPENVTTIRMSVAAISGSTTLTASRDYFTASNVGSLFRLASSGQTVQASISSDGTFSDAIRVTGTNRSFAISISGTWTGTLTLQRSIDAPGDWTDVATYTINTSTSYADGLNNQEIYYRIGFKTSAYGSGTAVLQLTYASGTISGVGRVTAFTDAKHVSLDVLTNFGNTTSTDSWWESSWSDRRGWPSAVAFHDGRLWWAGKDKIAGSVSDAFASFDDGVEGDSGPIYRTIGSGPVDTINWLLSLASMIVGGQGREAVAKASSLDEPLTPSAFSLKTASTLGSSNIAAVQLDASALYVHRNGSRLYEISLDGTTYSYSSEDVTAIVPEIGASGFLKIAIQRVPDTRVHCVRADGKVAILVYDRIEKVTCWVLYETDGVVEDVIIMPVLGGDDQVSYTVRRTIDGVTKRFFEPWADEAETIGGATTVLSDATYEYSGASTATITGIPLEGEDVVVWGNGKDLGSYTVTGGSITLSEAVTYAAIGLSYMADFKSARFAEASAIPLGQRQQLVQVGLILSNTHAQGMTMGQDFDHLVSLPLVEDGTDVDPDSIHASYVEDSIPVDGEWSNDCRLCLRAASPRPATVLAAIASVTGSEK